MKTIYNFTTTEKPTPDEVGSKALSLITMTGEGLPVPPGFVLTVSYFEPWIASLRVKPEWKAVQNSSLSELGQSTRALQSLANSLHLNHNQQNELNEAIESLQASTNANLFAIRSSSPEEDLEGASFAGSYETVLGVSISEIESAIRTSFTSCFDERVFLYKKQQGLPTDDPRIAVIVQQQIDADSAGVAFSLNPVNNCFDEAVIISNYGLGESVVAGQVTPDELIVDKVKRTITDTKIGSKEIAIKLKPEGGTLETTPKNYNQASITPEQILTLTDLLCKIEANYQKPVDIEWAFSGSELYLLQVRPITTYLPLTEEMLTAPGEPKRLYANATLIEQGIQEPLSVLSTDFLNYILKEMTDPFGGDVMGIDGTVFTSGGRYYLNLSNSMKLLGENASFAPGSYKDPTVVDILESIDLEEYKPKKLPKKLRSVKRKMIFSLVPTFFSALKAYRNPEAFIQKYREELPGQLQTLNDIMNQDLTNEQLATNLTAALNFFIMEYGFPMLSAPRRANSRIERMFKEEADSRRDELVSLRMSLPGNKTVEMGESMYHLASFNEVKNYDSVDEFIIQLEQRALSPEFLQAWDLFVGEYGFRCIREIDIATPRPNEHPALLFEQLKNLSLAIDSRANSKTIFEEARLKREAAFRILQQIAYKKGRRKGKAFEKLYNTVYTLGGYRETPKHYIVMVIDLFRKRVLQVAQTFMTENRLNDPDQIFDLTIADIDQAIVDSSLNLRDLTQKNTHMLNKIRKSSLVPRVIDSRGRVFNPPRKEFAEGMLKGVPISPGIVQGIVKVLHQVDEKKLLPGEILVTRATDPGWTPLFINAKGIILEIGGVLQHGAVVAREYGIPCVSGIDDVINKLEDGQMVEVDGSNGTVRILTDSTKRLHAYAIG